MKKIFLAAAVTLSVGSAQAQFSNLLNKAKDKVKSTAENGMNKKDSKTTSTTNTTTMTEQTTAQPPAADYKNLNDEAYIKTLDDKSMQVRMVRLDGTTGNAINAYYDRALTLDMAHFYPLMLKKGKPSDYNAGLDYEEVMKFRNEYSSTYENNFKPLVNGTIEGAYSLKKSNKLQAVNNLQAAAHLNDACLLVIPDLKSALELKGELDKAYMDIAGEQAKVFTSDFHKKNVGKILFSKEPIVPGKENPAQFTTSFAPNETIYAMAYLNGTIHEVTNTTNNDIAQGRYILKIDGTEEYVHTLEFNHNKEDYKKAFFPIEVRPEPAKAVHGLDATYFAERFGALSPRKHTVGISFTDPNNSGDAFAYGEIKIDWTAGDAEKMMADAKLAVSKAQTNYAKTVQLSDYFSKPNYVFQDPALSVANLKKAILASMPDAVQVLKLVTIKESASDDWSYNRNEYGVIVSKGTNHYTSFVYKAKDGNCYIHEVGQFFKVATGGGYGNLMMSPNGLIDKRIACENVK